MTPIPFGPDVKDPMWRWGSWIMGMVGFILLFWVVSPSHTLFLGLWRVSLFVILALVLSARSAHHWHQGREPERTFARKVQPTVAIDGKPGATYVLLEPAKATKVAKVRPRELGPIWWALYTVFVKAPMALGDAILTGIWRAVGARFEAVSGGRNVVTEDFDFAQELPKPDKNTF